MNENILLYCPKCSKKEFRQVDSKKFLCSNCDFTFYRNPSSAVAGIIEYEGKILLTRRGKEPGKGKLDLPGGFADYDESLEEALKREVKEELAINIKDLSYLCSFPNKYLYKGIEYSTIDSFFVCKAESLNIKKEENEIEEWKLVDHTEINIEEIAFVSIREALKKYIQNVT